MTATPSVDSVKPGDAFTVEFQVNLVASAGFLNGVYELLEAVEIPITTNQVTITPSVGAAGNDVVASAAEPVVIPAPASVPVSADVVVPIGSVVGDYTATTDGAISFSIAGNPFSPDDPLPAGFSEAGWTGAAAAAALTPTGAQTAARASLAGGLVKPYLVCVGGAWTANADGTYGAPLARGSFDIAINGVVPSTTTTSTIAPTTSSTTQSVLGNTVRRLPATGVGDRALITSVLLGLVLLQMGFLLHSVTRPNRRLNRLMQSRGD